MNDTEEKSLVKLKKHSIFDKIKSFMNKFFRRDVQSYEKNIKNETNDINGQRNDNDSFWSSIKNVETEETKLLKLQKLYRKGSIKEEELSKEEIILLCNLYDEQIAKLKKSNEIRKQKLLEYKKNLQTN